MSRCVSRKKYAFMHFFDGAKEDAFKASALMHAGPFLFPQALTLRTFRCRRTSGVAASNLSALPGCFFFAGP